MSMVSKTVGSKLPFAQVLESASIPFAKQFADKRSECEPNLLLSIDSFKKSMGRMKEVLVGKTPIPFQGRTLTFSTPEEMEEVLSSL